MLDYTYDLLIPANTPITSPATVNARLGKGRLERVYIGFEEGCGWMAHVCIEYRGFQFAPIINGQTYHLDNFVISVDCEQDLLYEPYTVTLKGWSTGTLYPHTIHFVLCVNPTDDNDDLANLVALLGVHHA